MQMWISSVIYLTSPTDKRLSWLKGYRMEFWITSSQEQNAKDTYHLVYVLKYNIQISTLKYILRKKKKDSMLTSQKYLPNGVPHKS